MLAKHCEESSKGVDDGSGWGLGYSQALEDVAQGAGRGLFSFKSGGECTIEKAKGTRSNQAAHLIVLACRKLYDEPASSEVEAFLNAAEAKTK